MIFLVAVSINLVSMNSSAYGKALSPGATLPSTTFLSGPPDGVKGPDDIALLSVSSVDGGAPVIWTAFQNGVQSNGTAGKPAGPASSTVIGFDMATGAQVKNISVVGKVDGLSADQDHGRLLATVNEDSHSRFNVIDVVNGAATPYQYSPDPAVSGNGGTDSIAISGSQVYVTHSNPNDTTQPAAFILSLDNSTYTAHLAPFFYCNSKATNVTSGASVQLGLTDPDSNFIMPSTSPNFAGDLATIGQADGQLVFATLQSTPSLSILTLTDNVPGNVPPTDGLAVATSDHGTLYVVETSLGSILALDTTGLPAGTVFIGEPKDNGNPIVGTLDLASGKISPLGNTFNSPKGLLFVPAPTQVTTSSSSSSSTTSASPTAIPGFPIESIIFGVAVGVAALFALKRKGN